LRRLLGDPLLVRVQAQLTLTPRAKALQAPLKAALEQVRALLEPADNFDPKASLATFTLAVSDYAEFVLLPRLIQRLSQLAPGVRVAVRHLGDEFPGRELESGRVDLVLGHFDALPSSLNVQPLFTEKLVCVLRRSHPQVREKGKLSAAHFTQLSHVRVAYHSGGLGQVDDALAANGLQRKIALQVPSFLVAPMVVAQTDLLGLLPARVAAHFSKLLPLRVLEPPLPLDGYAIAQVWATRPTPSLGLDWLRGVLVEVGSQVSAAPLQFAATGGNPTVPRKPDTRGTPRA
jgi:DNA-binding transcriptional LysR family regulator